MTVYTYIRSWIILDNIKKGNLVQRLNSKGP